MRGEYVKSLTNRHELYDHIYEKENSNMSIDTLNFQSGTNFVSVNIKMPLWSVRWLSKQVSSIF